MEARILGPTSRIGHLVIRDAVRVEPGCPLGRVASTMQEAGTSSVLVGVDGAIATERDVIRGMARGLGPDDPVSAVATPHAVRVPSDMSVTDAAALMLNEEIRHLVIALDGGGEGVISLRDLMAVLLGAASPKLWMRSLQVAVNAPAEIWLG